jgi:hypothetical protein
MRLKAGLALVIFCLTFLVLPIFLVALVIERLFWIGSLAMAWPSKSQENSQLLFYAAAARRTAETAWAFDGAKEVELIIVQPPFVKRWVTTLDRVDAFEKELAAAVKIAMKPDAPLASGDHCKWCAAKPVCPVMTGAVDRALKVKVDALPMDQIAHYLDQAPLVEAFIKDLQQLAHGLLESGTESPRLEAGQQTCNKAVDK